LNFCFFWFKPKEEEEEEEEEEEQYIVNKSLAASSPNKKDPFKGALPAINITSVSGSSTPKT